MTPSAASADNQVGNRLGLSKGMVVQELGWDDDVDDSVREAIENAIDADLVDGDYGDVVEAVILWWREGDGDLVDAFVDTLTDLVNGGTVWLLTPKVGRPGFISAASIAEGVTVAGLTLTKTASVAPDWQATRVVRPKGNRR